MFDTGISVLQQNNGLLFLTQGVSHSQVT